MAQSNVWIDILLGKVGEFYMRAVEEAEYFDFMTLFRRILADKTLMNFKVIIVKGNDVFQSPEVTLAQMSETLSKQSPKLDKAFKDLSNVVTVDDMIKSTYELHEDGEYSFMEVWWTFLVWVSLGDDGLIPIETFVSMVKDFREAITEEHIDPNEPLRAVMFTIGEEKRDLFQLIYQRLDHKLLAIKEMSFNGKKRIQDVIEQDLIYSH